jgi:hypothetical protein
VVDLHRGWSPSLLIGSVGDYRYGFFFFFFFWYLICSVEVLANLVLILVDLG